MRCLSLPHITPRWAMASSMAILHFYGSNRSDETFAQVSRQPIRVFVWNKRANIQASLIFYWLHSFTMNTVRTSFHVAANECMYYIKKLIRLGIRSGYDTCLSPHWTYCNVIPRSPTLWPRNAYLFFSFLGLFDSSLGNFSFQTSISDVVAAFLLLMP